MKLLNTHKKLVNLAVASVVAGGFAMTSVPAHAVNVSQNNVGQVALFPYYTVKNGFDTLMSVVNTSDKTVAFKIRFREALNSREVRDFNVIMSPYDVWTAAITKDASGDGAVLRTFDNTCTSPILPNSPTVSGAREVAFSTAGFDGTNTNYIVDGGGTAMTRVQEGYFEVIEMGASALSNTNSANVVEYSAAHVSGIPRSCVAVDNAFAENDFTSATSKFLGFTSFDNVLKGFASLINVANGTSVDTNPTHLENWLLSGTVLARPGDLAPDLGGLTGQAPIPDGSASWMYNGVVNNQVASHTPDAWDAVSGILSATNVINEYSTNAGAGVGTDWVVTYPTKHHYTDLGYVQNAGNGPFTQNFDYKNGAGVIRGKSCDAIGVAYWDREEASQAPSGNQFSPYTSASGSEFCYEVNVLTFNGSYVLGTGINHQSFDTTPVGTKGWLNLSQLGAFDPANTPANSNYHVVDTPNVGGLPTIGFAAIVRTNAAASTNFGDSEPHTYQRTN